jgi:hypothetical protein
LPGILGKFLRCPHTVTGIHMIIRVLKEIL